MRGSLFAVLLSFVLSSWADLVPPPPAVHGERPATEVPHANQEKGVVTPTVYSIGAPSDDEQLFLELLNRARMDPEGEALRLATNSAADILSAYRFFSVDLNQMYDAIVVIPPAPPLALNPKMITAARLHSGTMYTNTVQTHFDTNGDIIIGPGERLTAQGYIWQTYGENVFATGENPSQSHVAFEVDWGFGPGGMQDPPGHRENNHNPSFREVGVGFFYGSKSFNTTNGFTTNIVGLLTNLVPILENHTVGPDEVTVDFGATMNPVPFITGVAYYDVDGDQFYSEGEGLAGLSVTAGNLPASAITAGSGGYAFPAANGTYNVVFSLPGYASAPLPVTITGSNNAKVDLIVPYVAPKLTGPAQALVGGANVYTASKVPIATGYQWQMTQGTPYTAVEGAEAGTGNIIANVSGYSVISTDFAASGSSSFHLVHLTQNPQIITLKQSLKVLPGASASFSTLFGFATTNEVGSFEISTNAGASWFSLWHKAGITTSNQFEKTFTRQSVDLSPYVGAHIQSRFTFTTVGSYFNLLQKPYGVYLDNISFTNTESLSSPVITAAAPDGSFIFSPPALGKYYLSASPIVGSRTYPFGPELTVMGASSVPATAVTKATTIGLTGVPPNTLQITFKVLSGVASGFQLQSSPDITGPWQAVGSATVSTNGSGDRVYGVAPSAGRSFFRLAAQ